MRMYKTLEFLDLFCSTKEVITKIYLQSLSSASFQEPDFVALLVVHGVPELEKRWRRILKPYGISVSVTGVYTHQSPKVCFQGNTCEIGDLLVCHFHRAKDGRRKQCALLLQVKRMHTFPSKLKSRRELVQLLLFSRWPAFTYESPGFLKGQLRKIYPSAPRRGAQYLLLRDQPSFGSLLCCGCSCRSYGCCNAFVASPWEILVPRCCLSLEFVNLLSFTAGNRFLERSKLRQNSRGWSRVIWDLIEVGIRGIFNRNRSGFKGSHRQSGSLPPDLSFCLVNFRTVRDNYPFRAVLADEEYLGLIEVMGRYDDLNFVFWEKADDDEGGIPVMIIETTEEVERGHNNEEF